MNPLSPGVKSVRKMFLTLLCPNDYELFPTFPDFDSALSSGLDWLCALFETGAELNV